MAVVSQDRLYCTAEHVLQDQQNVVYQDSIHVVHKLGQQILQLELTLSAAVACEVV